MNLPNKLTCLRMFLVPILVIVSYLPIDAMCGFVPLKNIIMLVIFCVASITDYFDGNIARKRNMVTTFGKFLDPIADKLLVVATYIILVEMQILPAWVAILTEGRELLVAACRMLQAKNGNVVAASWYGKVKTVSQMIALIFAFLCNSSFFAFIGGVEAECFASGGVAQFVLNILFSIGICVALVATVFSGWDYIKSSKDLILESK